MPPLPPPPPNPGNVADTISNVVAKNAITNLSMPDQHDAAVDADRALGYSVSDCHPLVADGFLIEDR